MNRNVPALFFFLACVANLCGRIWEPALAAAVKPALLPLLALSVLAFATNHRLDRKMITLLVTAELFGCLGDICLIFDNFPLFASGIGAFLVGHIFYVNLFGGQSWKGMERKAWVGGAIVMVGLVFGLIKLLKIQGALLPPMAIYGFMLTLLMFSTFCGLVRLADKTAWGLLFAGSVLFTFSDCLIAAGTFHVLDFALREFVVMLTYLLAQTLLALGTLRLAQK